MNESDQKGMIRRIWKTKNRILLGCVADDFTGASDAASFLRNAGLRTLLMNEIQKDFPVPEQTDAV